MAGAADLFTVMAVFEAVDKMSKVLEQMDASLDKFSDTALKAAEAATESGAKIDESMLKTASGEDAAELAAARLATAQEKLTAATQQQAAAEKALLDARSSAASEDELASAAEAVAAAQAQAAESATALGAAQATLAAAQEASASEGELAAATDAVAAAEVRATAATNDLTAAREKQAALVTPNDVANAADAVTAAEKRTAAATNEVSTAQERQTTIQGILTGSTAEAQAAADAEAAAQARLAAQQKLAAAGAETLHKAMTYGALAIAAVGYESVKAAGNWQSLTTHLVTDAGESQKNLAMVSAGMLQLAAQTGTSTTDMANGMYHVESAGYHGAQALSVMKAAAEGAKVGGADLDTVSKALTGTMNAYSMSGSQATSMMNQLIAAVGSGDMRMQDLASSLGNVAPVAASAGISFAQVGGAIATMTSQNMSAQQATQDLAHTIGSLQKPNAVATKEMQALGLNVNSLSKNIGKIGLTGTLDELTAAVARNTKGGDVLISTFNSSKQAAANAQQEIKAMPASLQTLANAYLNGSVTSKQWTTDLQGLSPVQAALMKQFASTADQTQKFNSLLTSGSPAAQTYNAAMSNLLGGATGLKTALMLTGGRAATFNENVKAVGDAANKTGKDVTNWATIQGTFNQKMDVLKSSVEAAGVSIGQALLPMVSTIAGIIAAVVGPMATWLAQHQKWVGLALAVAGGIGAVVAAMKAWEIVQGVMNALTAIFAAEETAILSPIELVVIAIAALVAGLVYAYFHFSAFRTVVNDVFKAVKTVVVDAWHVLEAVWSALVTAVEWIGHVFAVVFDAIAGVVQDIWGVISGVWNTIVSVTTAVWDGISAFFAKWWPLLLVLFAAPIAILIGIWNHFHSQIMDVVHTVWAAIKDFLSVIWDGIKMAAQVAWLQIQLLIVNPIKAAWSVLMTVIHAIMSFLSSAWNAILGIVKAAWNAIKAAIIQPLEDAWNFLSGWVGKFLSIGTNIVEGIIQGIENAAGWLMSKISNLAGDALNAAKSILGINSPSKVFADVVGKAIPEGIAKGITDHAHLAHQAVSALSAGLTATAHTTVTGSFAGGGTSIPALGGAGAAGGINVTIDLKNAVVASNSSMGKLADSVGKEIVKQFHLAGYKTRVY